MTVVDCQTESVSDALVAQRLAQYHHDHVTQASLFVFMSQYWFSINGTATQIGY